METADQHPILHVPSGPSRWWREAPLSGTLLHDRAFDAVVHADTLGALDAIRGQPVALAIWRRHLPAAFAVVLAALDLATIEDVELTLDMPLPIPEIAADLVATGYPAQAASMLAADIAMLAEQHARLTAASRMTARLQVVETDACRKFHADWATLRMLCTYIGPATQWISAADPDRVEDAGTTAVAVLKGRLLLDPPSILHRSPPIIGTGAHRLLLTIDAVIRD